MIKRKQYRARRTMSQLVAQHPSLPFPSSERQHFTLSYMSACWHEYFLYLSGDGWWYVVSTAPSDFPYVQGPPTPRRWARFKWNTSVCTIISPHTENSSCRTSCISKAAGKKGLPTIFTHQSLKKPPSAEKPILDKVLKLKFKRATTFSFKKIRISRRGSTVHRSYCGCALNRLVPKSKFLWVEVWKNNPIDQIRI